MNIDLNVDQDVFMEGLGEYIKQRNMRLTQSIYRKILRH